uniref:Hypoxia up-regulated protein 1 n=1 Tax=Arion vulgaris TaxID=1028688 RepID=A0A0B7AHG5_9EUPU
MVRELHQRGLLVLLVLILACASVSARLAVMSIDLGGEYMKVAIVKPGVPMEIVLNRESSRKTPTIVAFRDGERHFSSQAENTALKFPQKAVGYLMQVLGRQYDDPQVDVYRSRFPYYTLLKDEDRGTVLFKIDEDTVYSCEELLAMILEKAKEYTQDFAEQEVKDAVITVPPFYNQAERRAVLTAAKLVGINVLQLMSDNAAVALNYGIFRRKNFNSTTQYYMFYDMGSTSTTATIVGYSVVKTKEGTRMESNPQLTIKGVGFDRTLGGLEFTLRLRAHLAKTFNGQKKTTLKVEENYRAMAKLLKEAERVKKVLSANVDHHAQIENLIDEKDLRIGVSRVELEDMTQDLTARVTRPIEEALKVSEITLPEITEVILMGGGTRMPKVQEILMKYLGRTELGKSINTDEAAALGAVYQAAYLGKGFKVKKFGVREGNIYPINVEFEKQRSEDDTEDKNRIIKRTIFGRMNPYPQKKVMTFNKHTKDFTFDVVYSGLEFLTEVDRKSFGTPLISRYRLTGVEEALSKNKDKAESRGIKAHFEMDGSGILTLDRVESVFEKNDTADAAEKSTWSKLGSAIGGLFSSSSDEEPKVEDSQEDPPEPDQETDGSSDEQKEEGEDKTEQQDGKKEEETDKTDSEEKTEEKEKKEPTPEDGPAESGTEQADKSDKKEAETKEKAAKVVSIKENIQVVSEILDVQDFSEEKFLASKKKLTDLRKLDHAKIELEQSKNDLESFIFDFQDKLGQGPHEKCSTEDEREKLFTLLSETSDWLYEHSADAKKSEFKEKLKALKDKAQDILKRVYEVEERPKAMEALRETLNQTEFFLATVKNFSDIADPIFTQVEMDTLEKLINETRQWRDETVAAQKKLKPYDNPVLLVEDVAQRIVALERERRYLINKIKNFKPKAKPKDEKKKDENITIPDDSSTTDDTQEDTPPTDDSKVEDDDAIVVEEEDAAESVKTDEEAATEKKSDKGSVKEKKGSKKTKDKSSSSGKKRPKSKRKDDTEDAAEPEDILELDADTDKSKSGSKKKSHIEL